ncbi:cupin domain-containing protein [Okeania sp. SIO2C2]|uniref:cupin domain-containing protein n=1 Tax=Okeania sp. SIO2C2 TaxID=2607787 RepID=UPI00257C2599|nr:cupin domain-containing protein [Okeania sp. SIO2C2]
MFGMLLILGNPNYSQTQLATASTLTDTPLTTENSIILDPNTTYKVDRTPEQVDVNDLCYGKTAQVKFSFKDSEFEKDLFEETYPIQDNWDLFFSTPDTNISAGLLFKDLTECDLEPEPAPLELLSGYKKKDQADNLKNNAHFVVAKDYYAYDQKREEYKKLGSLTAIGGTEFPVLRGSAIGQLIIKPNSIRAPHWHLKYTETGYCYGGLGQVGIIVPGNTLPKGGKKRGFFSEPRVEEFFVKPGEIFHFPEASQHYLRNVGTEPFECVLFFGEGQALTEDKLLTITLQNVVGGTPLGVLGPILVTDDKESEPVYYTAQRVSEAPEQTYSSVDQGPEIVQVVEACSGEAPDVSNPGCPPMSEIKKKIGSRFSVYSTLKP